MSHVCIFIFLLRKRTRKRGEKKEFLRIWRAHLNRHEATPNALCMWKCSVWSSFVRFCCIFYWCWLIVTVINCLINSINFSSSQNRKRRKVDGVQSKTPSNMILDFFLSFSVNTQVDKGKTTPESQTRKPSWYLWLLSVIRSHSELKRGD